MMNSVAMPPIYNNESLLRALDCHETEENGASFATFKQECERLGIDVDEANNAAKQSLAFYKKWWWYDDEDTAKDNDVQNGFHKDNMDDLSHSGRHNPKSDSILSSAPDSLIVQAKTEALIALRSSFGDTSTPHFQCALKALSSIYRQSTKAVDVHKLEGEWLTLSRPNFPDCLGQNINGDFVYTLGRMSFDMFRPNNLRCSIKKIVNNISKVELRKDHIQNIAMPRGLRKSLLQLNSSHDANHSQEHNHNLSLHTFE